MSWLDQVIGYGTLAARPAAGSAGRLYYATDTKTIYRDSGATWDALTAGAAVQAYSSVAINTTTATETILGLDSTQYDRGTTSPQHSDSVNNSRLTCQQSGVYLITGSVQYDSSGVGDSREVRFHVNGTLIFYHAIAPQAVEFTTVSASIPWFLNDGDYVELGAYQNSGGDLLVQNNVNTPMLALTRMA